MFYQSRRKRLHCHWPQCCFVLYQILQYVYFLYEVVNNQTPSLRQGISLLRENINIFMNVTYWNMFIICIYNIYNIIPLLCKKVKFHIKYLFGNRLCYTPKEPMIFISNLWKCLSISLSCLLHDGFHSCLFLYSCMLRCSVGHVSCQNINRNSLSYICN